MNSIKGTVNWGIIGCGDVCEIKSGPAFNKVSNSKLLAVMRRDVRKAEDFARRHQVPVFYDDAEQLIKDDRVNAIYIATPPSSHESFAMMAIQAGKPVYVEKPVSISAESCERMLRQATQSDIKVSVAHYRRGLSLFQEVKSVIGKGMIGDVRLIRISVLQPFDSKIVGKTDDRWRVNPEISGGGIFHDLSPHQLDIMYWIFGTPLEFHGHSVNQSHQYNAPDLTKLEAIYDGNICLSGIWAFNVAASAAEEQCVITGSKGSLKFSFFRKSPLEITTETGTEVREFDFPENIQLPMIDSVVRYFRGEGPNPCSLEEALVTMKMMDSTRR